MKAETPSITSPERPIALAILLLLSFLFVGSPSDSAGASNSLYSGEPFEIAEEISVERGSWDWSSYADHHGYVDVVVVHSDEIKSDFSDQALAKLAEHSRAVAGLIDKSNTSGHGFSKREFHHAFSGIATRLSIESILELEACDDSVSVYPDLEVTASVGQNIYQVGADQVWGLSDSSGNPVKGSGVVVAVIDTGVDYTHPDLGGGFGPGYKVMGGYDFVNNDANPMDDNGHGTHVAGIVAASGGVTGVAPKASILAYKVLSEGGSGTMSDVIAGIEAAMDPNDDGDTSDHADVISMSLGGAGTPGDPLCLAVRSAVNAGIIVVVAAGNDGPSIGTVASPGIEPLALTVGAIDAEGNLASFSSRGTSSDSLMKPEVSAPGVSISSTVPYSGATYSSTTGYRPMSGTSMATPHVSGVAALLLQLHPDWSPNEVKSAIITGCQELDESFWHAGAGGLWAPDAAFADVFLGKAELATVSPGGAPGILSLINGGSAAKFSLSTVDFNSALYNGSQSARYWTNASTASPTTISLSSGGIGTATISVVAPAAPSPEGYYDGILYLTTLDRTVRIPFGFVVLSNLNLHVLNKFGNEVNDARGVAFVYSYPDASIALLSGSTPSDPCPPTSFRLPSGTYSVHAIGHQLLYSFSDPYVLSGRVSLGRLSTVDVYLRMADAREFALDLTTDDGNPIYIKDFVMYCRYVGLKNVSALAVSSDSSIIGDEVFSLAKSKHIYISDTDANIGISAAGFSYSSDMWDFMSRNWGHWYEFSDSSSTQFLIESTADLQYLLSWEFQGVDSSRPLDLDINEAKCSVFHAKYDIPGSITRIWGAGNHMSTGGDATLYVRRDIYASLNPFFSGMTRTTIVQGVYFEKYWPGSLSDVYLSPQYYVPDFNHVVKASDVSDVYLADRMFLAPIEGVEKSVRFGAGPYYPSVQLMNSASQVVLIHPILRDSGGARVGTPETPWMYLLRDGSVTYSCKLDEYRGSPNPMRVVPISGGKNYQIVIPSWSVASQVSNTAQVTLNFSIDKSDKNPPTVTGLALPEKFVPGTSITLELSATDDVAVANVVAWSRSSDSSTWKSLMVQDLGTGTYRAIVQTAAADTGIDLKFSVTDTSGNSLEYTTTHASLKQIPIAFGLSFSSSEVSYVDGDASVVVSGHLTDSNGSPLCSENVVPIELMLGDRKVGMILDEDVQGSTHHHDGTIRYEWHFNPAKLFTGVGQTIEISATVDLGVYESKSVSLFLHSVKTVNSAPIMRLVSPANGSLIPAGETIDLSVWDDGVCTVRADLDGKSLGELSSPWDVNTSSWTDGIRSLSIVATDSEGASSRATYSFNVDASAPVVTISYPTNGSNVPIGSRIYAEVGDAHLAGVIYSLDGLPGVTLGDPYDIDMSAWSDGYHTVVIKAVDVVGHTASQSVSFTIVRGSVAIGISSPLDWSVLHSGTPIVVSVLGNGVITSKWSEYGVWHDLGDDHVIPTTGWLEGTHDITINATNDLGEYDQLDVSITVDDTPPEVVLNSPVNNSYVGSSSAISFTVLDANLKCVSYTIWNSTYTSALGTIFVPMNSCPSEGLFSLWISSIDKAGNQKEATFSFTMDMNPPLMSVANFVPGNPLKPGSMLNFTITDAFLDAVTYSFDSGAVLLLSSPYGIDTTSLCNGWHVLQVIASDLSGKESRFDMSFYVDAVSPAVELAELSSFIANADLEVQANAVDDFGLKSAVLYVELRTGGYEAVEMAVIDGSCIAAVPAGMLWDGMRIYVDVCDSAGNVARSEAIVLRESTLPGPGGGSPDGHDNNGFEIVLGSIIKFLPLIPMSLVSILCVVLYVRRRNSDDEFDESTQDGSSRALGEPSKSTTVASAPSSSVSSIGLSSASLTSAAAPVLPLKMTASMSQSDAKKVALVDAIPDILVPRIEEPRAMSEDRVDDGVLIERELNHTAQKHSVFGLESELDALLDEIDRLSRDPRIVSGLQLKKGMDH